MKGLISENIKLVSGVAPVADAFSGTVTSDAVNLGLYDRCTFVVIKGAGATGTSTLTVRASSDNAGTGAEAIAFKYRQITGDTAGEILSAEAAGFTTTAGASEMYVVEILAQDTPDGKPYVDLVATEVVDSPVAGAVLVLLGNPRFSGASMPSAIA